MPTPPFMRQLIMQASLARPGRYWAVPAHKALLNSASEQIETALPPLWVPAEPYTHPSGVAQIVTMYLYLSGLPTEAIASVMMALLHRLLTPM